MGDGMSKAFIEVFEALFIHSDNIENGAITCTLFMPDSSTIHDYMLQYMPSYVCKCWCCESFKEDT